MLGIVFLLCHIALGIVIMWRVLGEQLPAVRVWAGVTCGIIIPMVGVMPFAFIFDFTPLANVLTLVISIGLAVWACLALPRPKKVAFRQGGWVWMAACTLPLTAVMAYLLHTHTLLADGQGNLLVGQSTFGDLCLHAGIAQGLAVQQAFPPEYTLFAGLNLNYPFLADSLSAALIQMGTSLRMALLLPQLVMSFCVFAGFATLAYEVMRSRRRAGAATAFFFLGGGFGFAYFFDMLKENPDALTNMMQTFYETPTNFTGKGIRWVNAICDLMVPQRTLLFGWGMLFLALWLLYRAMTAGNRRDFYLAGLVAGMMPMVHTHSFLALGMISAVWMFAYFPGEKALRKDYIIGVAIYGTVALCLSMPQLFYWTFRQTGGQTFLWWNLDWCNTTDHTLWFWLKNLGLFFLAIPLALLGGRPRTRRMALASLPIIAISEVLAFQPNPYDNNKLMMVAFALLVIAIVDWMADVYGRLAGMPGRRLLAGMVVVACTLSGTMSLAREAVSSYQVFSGEDVAFAQAIRDNTLRDGIFITADQHNQPVSTLAGRRLYTGTPIYLYYHGVSYGERAQQVQQCYESAGYLLEHAGEMGVDYLVLTDAEQRKYAVQAGLGHDFPIVIHMNGRLVYAVSPRAQAALEGGAGQ
nr:hypothetical protein [bacterium]